jgi:putative oxygen-independent coproporphyrinogen III oxidase
VSFPDLSPSDPHPSVPRPGEGWGLYVHFPWCVRKCPYCDFNSHVRHGPLPEADYIAALLSDLDFAVACHGRRPLATVFLGGGTPNLFSPETIAELLNAVRRRLPVATDVEITMEANPGADDRARWRAYAEAGVNRLSLGVQSLDDRALRALGRIHDAAQARRAYDAARAAGFTNINLDLMTGLPGQSTRDAWADLDALLDLAPEHVSWYELTYESGTPFARRPPPRLDEDARARLLEEGRERLARAGYVRYEISAYARQGRRSRHNLGYWLFSDYLGIGAGAHAKISARRADAPGRIGVRREERIREPRRYLAAADAGRLAAVTDVEGDALAAEFFLNAWRLVDGFEEEDLRRTTRQDPGRWRGSWARAEAWGLARHEGQRWRPTSRGLDMLLDLQELFLEPLDVD